LVREKIVPRGFLKSYILKLLRSGPKYGYSIIKSIENETGWRPSSGGIYPTLHDLEKRGLIIKFKEGRRKYYKLTKEGKFFIKKFDESLGEVKDRFRSFVDIMSQILDVKESELTRMMEPHIKSSRNFFLLSPNSRRSLLKFRTLVFKIAKDKSKYKKLERVLKETNKKLKNLAGE